MDFDRGRDPFDPGRGAGQPGSAAAQPGRAKLLSGSTHRDSGAFAEHVRIVVTRSPRRTTLSCEGRNRTAWRPRTRELAFTPDWPGPRSGPETQKGKRTW